MRALDQARFDATAAWAAKGHEQYETLLMMALCERENAWRLDIIKGDWVRKQAPKPIVAL